MKYFFGVGEIVENKIDNDFVFVEFIFQLEVLLFKGIKKYNYNGYVCMLKWVIENDLVIILGR